VIALQCDPKILNEIWQECLYGNYASIDGVGLLILHQNFKMKALSSFHAEKCCPWKINMKHLHLSHFIKEPAAAAAGMYAAVSGSSDL